MSESRNAISQFLSKKGKACLFCIFLFVLSAVSMAHADSATGVPPAEVTLQPRIMASAPSTTPTDSFGTEIAEFFQSAWEDLQLLIITL